VTDVWDDDEFAGSVWLTETGDHRYLRVDYEGQWVGIHEFHLHPVTGRPCGGWAPFAGTALDTGNGWTVESLEPLTLSPSLLCRICGNHGFIRAGRWIEA